MLQQENAHIISVEPEYPLMPESSGQDLEDVVHAFCHWVRDHLELTLRSFNASFSVDWSRVTIFGESFGAYPAVLFWLNLKRIVETHKLQFRGMVLRWPLAGEYKRTWVMLGSSTVRAPDEQRLRTSEVGVAEGRGEEVSTRRPGG